MKTQTNSGGFTMMEFILVVAISAILILGLAAIVEMPSRMVEDEVMGDAPISSVDRAVAWLDEEVRYAKDVAVLDPRTLQITTDGGETVTYSYDGVAGGDLTRSALSGSSVVLGRIQDLVFTLGLTPRTVRAEATAPPVQTNIEVGRFDDFVLEPGWVLDTGEPVPPGTKTTTKEFHALSISDTQRAGIFFSLSSMPDLFAVPTMIHLRLRRSGPHDLIVRVYKADGGSTWWRPNRTKFKAHARVANSALPVVMSDVAIPLTPEKPFRDGLPKFVELSSAGPGVCAEIEAVTLDRWRAVAPMPCTFLLDHYDDGWYVMTNSPDSSQTQFSFEVGAPDAEVPVIEAESIELIATSVQVTVELASADGGRPLSLSVPVENNLALVNQ